MLHHSEKNSALSTFVKTGAQKSELSGKLQFSVSALGLAKANISTNKYITFEMQPALNSFQNSATYLGQSQCMQNSNQLFLHQATI